MNFENKIIEAKKFTNCGNLQKAKEIYNQILLTDEFQEKYSKVYFEFIIILLQGKLYDEAIQMLIKAYEAQCRKETIINLIDKIFYNPNIDKMRILYYDNMQMLQSVHSGINVIRFENLPLKFIPVSDKRFYIFDRRTEKFIGDFCIDIINTNNVPIDDKSIMLRNIYNINYIKQYEKVLEKKLLYLIYDPIDEFSSYLQVMNYGDVITNPHVKIFFTLIDFIAYFDKEEHMPESIFHIDQDDSYLKFLRFKKYMCSTDNIEVSSTLSNPITDRKNKAEKILLEKPWNIGNKKILLSIAIPTWNRGQRALENVQHSLKLNYNAEIEIVVCDNGSLDEDGKYREISLINDPRLKYYKNDVNIGFAKNMLKAIEHSQGKYVYIISDEDFVNLDAIDNLLEVLRADSDIAVLRGSMRPKLIDAIPGNCTQFDKNYEFNKGYDALLNAAFQYNYISASIYNRDIIMEKKIHEKYIKKVDEYIGYPHLYLDALLCVSGKYKLLSDVICLEGVGEKIIDDNVNNVSQIYSYEGRLEQHAQFLEMLNEVLMIIKCNDEIKIANLYMKLCVKTVRLIILVNGFSYQKNGRNLQIIAAYAYFYCLKLAENLFKDKYIKQELQKKLQLVLGNYWDNFCKMYGKNYEMEII